MKKLLFTAVMLFVALFASAQTEIKVETHRVVSVGEQFNLTFIIEGENAASDFSWTPSEGFQVLWGPQSGRSTSVSIINGKRTKSVQSTFTYVLRPVSAGKFTIPAAKAVVKNVEISSSPVSVEVVGENRAQTSTSSASGSSAQTQPSDQPSQTRREDVFLDLSVSRKDVVVGEPVIATLKLYQKVNVAGFEGVTFPSFDGFWSQELEAPTNIEFARESYNGQIYNAALLRKFVLIPQHQGILTIDPAELVCLVQVRVSSGGSSIFDGFFDDYKTVKQRAVSESVDISVAPLPGGAPACFGGGVGVFNISAELSKGTIKTHEAASLVITLSGQGNVALLEAPKVNFPPDMEVYDTKMSDNITKGGLTGSKTYEFPFIPRSHGDFVIEPVRYAYYDVDQKKYVTLQTDSLYIKVEKGNEAESGPVISTPINRKDVRNLGNDIRFINVKESNLTPKGAFFVGSVGFWIAVALMILLSVILWAAFRKIVARRADVAGTKNRKATKMALKRLHLSETFLKQNLYTAFYEELHKALLGFVSDKMNMPVADLSKDRISEAMAERGVAQAYIDTFIGLLDACEYARYAPSAGNEAMVIHFNSAVDVISSIDSDMKTTKTAPKTAYMAVLLLMMASTTAVAQQNDYADSLWNSTNAAYTEGRWEDAVAGYEMIEAMGLESAPLYCNTGNAYFKTGNLSKAILNYERALKVDPSYDDARFNLEYLNGMIQDRIDPVPEFIMTVWARNMSRLMDSDAWAVTFLVLLALSLVMMLIFLLASSVSGRKAGFYMGLILILLAAVCLWFSIWQKNEYMKADRAVVMCPVSSVKSSPSSESSQNLFILHEGTKVEILDQVGSWSNIELADGRQGWIRTSDVEII